ncbi:MAG TPA: hypothetical protein VKA34_03780 [Balneolales bacterium]|nr:hypothetical protein [Balneolales bacterium]
MKKLNFAEMGKTLSRSEMKQIMAGSGSNTCTSGCCNCHGGISCGPALAGQYGQTECYNNGYPNYGCSYGGSPCTG